VIAATGIALRGQAPVIFVVDDDLEVRRALVRLLRDSDYVLHVFQNPVDALERIDELAPDLIISDNEMPKMTGLEFLKKVRGERPAIRTLMLTSGRSGGPIHDARAAGQIDKLIQKPWHSEPLRAAVRELLSTPSSPPPPSGTAPPPVSGER
jgi:CheY-like chemotaxis protein